ncbi:MAG: matrixin family metalloprotease, partial [Pseudomonadota bacterium]
MCMMCGVNPTSEVDGTHSALEGWLSKSDFGPAGGLATDLDPESGAFTAALDVGADGSVTGTLSDEGIDFYRLDLKEGETVTIDLAGLGLDALEDTVLALFCADGTLLGVNDDIARGSELGSRLTFTATGDGPVYLRVSGFSADNMAAQGSYQLEVSQESAASGAASLDTLAEFLAYGYWSTPFHWNLGDSGYYAKDGTLTFTLDGYANDADGISAARQDLVREAFKIYEEILGIDFVETSDQNADFRFGDNQGGAYAQTAYANINGQGVAAWSNININASWYGSSSALDKYTFQTALHEIGHALGLGHQGSYNGSASYSTDAEFANDSWQASMMSYFSQNENTTIDASYAFLLSPMAADWLALDSLYGQYGYG